MEREGRRSDGDGRWAMDVCFFCVCFFVGFVGTVITVYTIRFVLLDAYCVDGSGDGDRVGEGAEPCRGGIHLAMGFMVNTNEAHHILYNMLTVLYILRTVFVQLVAYRVYAFTCQRGSTGTEHVTRRECWCVDVVQVVGLWFVH